MNSVFGRRLLEVNSPVCAVVFGLNGIRLSFFKQTKHRKWQLDSLGCSTPPKAR